MQKLHTNNKGFIAIVSILIISTVSMFFAISMLLDGVTNASLSINSLNYENARINANSCLDDALIRIKRENQFSGAISYTLFPGNSCTASIVWAASDVQVKTGLASRTATLTVTGTSNNFVRRFRHEIKLMKFAVNHSDGTVTHMNTINTSGITELSS